jgi:muramidase (phage lysozyme)
MSNFFDQFDSSKADSLRSALANPNVQTYLGMLRNIESGNVYNKIYKGGTFNDYSAHPNIAVPFTDNTGRRQVTHAGGAYQFQKTTWDGVASKYGLTDFSPASQDLGAIALLKQNGSLDSVMKGDFNTAMKKDAGTWAALPTSTAAQNTATQQAVNAQLNKGNPTQSTNYFDQFDTPNIVRHEHPAPVIPTPTTAKSVGESIGSALTADNLKNAGMTALRWVNGAGDAIGTVGTGMVANAAGALIGAGKAATSKAPDEAGKEGEALALMQKIQGAAHQPDTPEGKKIISAYQTLTSPITSGFNMLGDGIEGMTGSKFAGEEVKSVAGMLPLVPGKALLGTGRLALKGVGAATEMAANKVMPVVTAIGDHPYASTLAALAPSVGHLVSTVAGAPGLSAGLAAAGGTVVAAARIARNIKKSRETIAAKDAQIADLKQASEAAKTTTETAGTAAEPPAADTVAKPRYKMNTDGTTEMVPPENGTAMRWNSPDGPQDVTFNKKLTISLDGRPYVEVLNSKGKPINVPYDELGVVSKATADAPKAGSDASAGAADAPTVADAIASPSKWDQLKGAVADAYTDKPGILGKITDTPYVDTHENAVYMPEGDTEIKDDAVQNSVSQSISQYTPEGDTEIKDEPTPVDEYAAYLKSGGTLSRDEWEASQLKSRQASSDNNDVQPGT